MHRIAVYAVAFASAALAACVSMDRASTKTRVEDTWKDPKYAAAPMKKLFVVSLMKVEPGGRGAVENAIVARLQSAGVAGVASHTVMSDDAEKPGPTLEEAIVASGADGVLIVQVRRMAAPEQNMVNQTVSSIMPDTMASYDYLKQQNVYQPGDYKVANIVSELYLPSLGRQVWTAWTNSYDAADLAKNIPDYTLKLVGAMSRDRMIAGVPVPPS
ncbi:MAG: hypothetical protein U1F15_06720 [Burkholderiales bacterium]